MKTWSAKVKAECEAIGFTFEKRDDNGHWEMKEGDKVFKNSRSLGDILLFAGNTLEIPVETP